MCRRADPPFSDYSTLQKKRRNGAKVTHGKCVQSLQNPKEDWIKKKGTFINPSTPRTKTRSPIGTRVKLQPRIKEFTRDSKGNHRSPQEAGKFGGGPCSAVLFRSREGRAAENFGNVPLVPPVFVWHLVCPLFVVPLPAVSRSFLREDPLCVSVVLLCCYIVHRMPPPSRREGMPRWRAKESTTRAVSCDRSCVVHTPYEAGRKSRRRLDSLSPGAH